MHLVSRRCAFFWALNHRHVAPVDPLPLFTQNCTLLPCLLEMFYEAFGPFPYMAGCWTPTLEVNTLLPAVST